jgi:trans-2-enoyl-CoA reductase
VRALHFPVPGDPRAVLTLVELPEPEPRAGELLVEVLASPISPMDRLMVRGLYPLLAPGGCPGAQGVGRVLALGEGVAEPQPGTNVLLPARCGAWRERLTVPATAVVVLPPERDPIGACTLRIEALTAAVLLDELEVGDWFIHSPGAGSVGRYLISLARARGLRGIALVGSREPIADLWGLGADNVLVREQNLPTRLTELGLPQAHVAFDGSGGSTTALLSACVRQGGELIVYGATSRQPVQLSVDQLVFRDIHVRGFWLHHFVAIAGEPLVKSRLEALAASDVREHVIGCYGLDDWAEAFARAELEGARGRIVLTPTTF